MYLSDQRQIYKLRRHRHRPRRLTFSTFCVPSAGFSLPGDAD